MSLEDNRNSNSDSGWLSHFCISPKYSHLPALSAERVEGSFREFTTEREERRSVSESKEGSDRDDESVSTPNPYRSLPFFKSKKKSKIPRSGRCFKGKGIATSLSFNSLADSTRNFPPFDPFFKGSQENLNFIVKKYHIPLSFRISPNENERLDSPHSRLFLYIDLFYFSLKLLL